MKKILIGAALLSCLLSGCKKVQRLSYSGVFKLEKQTISDGNKDTTWIRKQMKVYTDRNYIYGGMASDSSIRIGIGSYELDSGNRVVEHNIFNSKALDSTQIFVVSVKKTNAGFVAVVPDWGRTKYTTFKLTEEYSKLPLGGSSALDGVWELDEIYRVKGKDTARQHETKFKVFWRGHSLFIHRYSVAPVGDQYKDGFGYGTFSLKNNILCESEKMASQINRVNRSFNTRVTFSGPDKFLQLFTVPGTHEQTTELYKRIRQF